MNSFSVSQGVIDGLVVLGVGGLIIVGLFALLIGVIGLFSWLMSL